MVADTAPSTSGSRPVPAKDPQQAVLQAWYDHFRSGGGWPEFDRVDRRLRRAARIDAAQVAVGIPETLLVTHAPRGAAPSGRDLMRLTVAGIERCAGGEDDVELGRTGNVACSRRRRLGREGRARCQALPAGAERRGLHRGEGWLAPAPAVRHR